VRVLCIDEKTSIQDDANIGRYPPAPGWPIYVEHEYVRAGALAYLAVWDVHRTRLSGRCERKNGIAAFHHLVAQVMGREPYRSARRVFLIADHGACHRDRGLAEGLDESAGRNEDRDGRRTRAVARHAGEATALCGVTGDSGRKETGGFAVAVKPVGVSGGPSRPSRRDLVRAHWRDGDDVELTFPFTLQCVPLAQHFG